MSGSFLTRKGSVGRSVSTFSSRKAKKTALAMVSATAALVPLIVGSQKAMATLTWDGSQTLPTAGAGGGTGNWDTTAGNNVWYNGTADTVYSNDTSIFGGTAGTVTVDGSVGPTAIIFNTTGYTIGGTSTLTLGSLGISTGVSLFSANETINAPFSTGAGTWAYDGTLTFGGPILGGAKPVLGAATTDSATYIFTGDMSQYSGTAFEIGGGNNVATLTHTVTMVYDSTAVSPTAGVGAGVFGASTSQFGLAYQSDLVVDEPMNIVGEFALTGGGNQGLNDLSQNGETISGTANLNIGFNANNGANTTFANPINAAEPLAFSAANTGNFFTNDISGGSITIGQAGAASGMTLSSTNAGRIVTFAGTGSTIINSDIQDGNKVSLNYVNSILAYNGTGGSLTVSNPLNNYKGATYIEQGTLKLGATNALPTGQNLPSTATGGTPGLIVFGDTDSTKNAGGILDLNGFNQTVSGLGIQTALAPSSISSSFQNAIWTVSAANAAGTSSFLTIAGFSPYETGVGLAIGEGININGQSGTIISLANDGGSSASLLVGLSFDPAAGSYNISSGTIILTPTAATASNQIIGNSSTTSNSTLTFDGGNTGGTFASGEGVSSTSTFGGTIQNSINGGTKQVSLVVGAGTLNLTGINTYTGGTTVSGPNGAVLNVEGLIANDSSAGVLLGVTPAFGTHDNIISRAVANGGSYAGLGASDSGTFFNTRADLLQGANTSNGGTLMVSMEMRTQTLADDANLPANAFELSSDILGLTGMVIGGGASGQTDPFALQLSFNPGFVGSFAAGSLYLAYTNNAESIPFSNAVNGDFATGLDAVTDVQSSYAAFAAANGITNANLGNYLGSWGVDTTGDTAWAIVDHNSQFAVVSVPEPATLGLLALSGLTLLGRRRRKAN
jgi:fibronectin-binding autotransporter adhesin